MRGRVGGNRAAGKVLDMGCGKGGDLSKWVKAKIREYVGIGMSCFPLSPVLCGIEFKRL